MAAYIIVNVEITDPVRYAEYVKLTPGTLAPYGGRFLVRGGKAELLEGKWEPKRVVVLEFDTFQQAKDWWNSKEYRPARDIRRSASRADLIVVEGWSGAPPESGQK